ncbi:MAG: methionyl-tRNA formyltransferase [Pseudomonadota bacterium]
MNVVFMGTPDFAARILDRVRVGRHPVVGVVCQPDRVRGRQREPQPPPVKTLAQLHGIDVYQPRSLRRRFMEWLDAKQPDAILVAAYGRLLPAAVLEHPQHGCINVHPSLLPRHRGPAPIQWSIASGDTHTGVTIMQMDAGMDTGGMLRQVKVALGPADTADVMHDRLADLGAELLLETLDAIGQGEAPVTPQDDAAATLAPMLTRENGRLDWSLAAGRVEARLRGFHPWPGSWTRFRGKVLKVFPPGAVGEGAEAPPGTLLGLDASGRIGVACGEGTMWLSRVQLEGRRAMDAVAFVHGARLQQGDAFES